MLLMKIRKRLKKKKLIENEEFMKEKKIYDDPLSWQKKLERENVNSMQVTTPTSNKKDGIECTDNKCLKRCKILNYENGYCLWNRCYCFAGKFLD